VPAADPWEQLGNQEELGGIPMCEAQYGIPTFSIQARRRYPIQRSPVGDPPVDAKLKLVATTSPECYTDSTSGHAELDQIVAADQIAPAQPAEHEMEHTPPWNIDLTTLFDTTFTCTPTAMPSSDIEGNLDWPCGAPGGRMDTRLLWPIMRVVNRVGWTVKLDFVGSVPKCVYNLDLPGEEIFRLRFGMNDVQSWNHFIDEINGEQELWSFIPYDFCDTQPVSFSVWIPIYFCDQVIDMWEPNAWWDDYLFNGEPIAYQPLWHGSFSLSITGVQLLGPA
jgi:hypothetical protein